jgi:hypothetical protein
MTAAVTPPQDHHEQPRLGRATPLELFHAGRVAPPWQHLPGLADGLVVAVGDPRSGRTSLLHRLAERGWQVLDEPAAPPTLPPPGAEQRRAVAVGSPRQAAALLVADPAAALVVFRLRAPADAGWAAGWLSPPPRRPVTAELIRRLPPGTCLYRHAGRPTLLVLLDPPAPPNSGRRG